MKFRKLVKYTALPALALASSASQAALDVTAVTTGFADLTVALTTVGGLLIGAAVVAVSFKWVKGMIFG